MSGDGAKQTSPGANCGSVVLEGALSVVQLWVDATANAKPKIVKTNAARDDPRRRVGREEEVIMAGENTPLWASAASQECVSIVGKHASALFSFRAAASEGGGFGDDSLDPARRNALTVQFVFDFVRLWFSATATCSTSNRSLTNPVLRASDRVVGGRGWGLAHHDVVAVV